jgi:hypothetical protein
VQKPDLMQAAAFHLGLVMRRLVGHGTPLVDRALLARQRTLVMRRLIGHGTPRALAGAAQRLFALISGALTAVWDTLHTTLGDAMGARDPAWMTRDPGALSTRSSVTRRRSVPVSATPTADSWPRASPIHQRGANVSSSYRVRG